MAVHPRQEVAVDLDDGRQLLRTDEVAIVQRFLNGKMVDNPGAVSFPLYQLKKDISLNGKISTEGTLIGKIGQLYREARSELESFQKNPEASQGAKTQESGSDTNQEETQQSPKQNGKAGSRARMQQSKPENNECRAIRKKASKNPKEERNVEEPSSQTEQQERPESSERSPLKDSAIPLRKRKQNKDSSPGKPKKGKANFVPPPDKPWKANLERRLQACSKAREGRRCNHDKIDAKESALRMAIKVRMRIDDLLEREDTHHGQLVKKLADGELEGEYSEERIWAYLTGDPNNLISTRILKEMTADWQQWLDRTT